MEKPMYFVLMSFSSLNFWNCLIDSYSIRCYKDILS